MKGMQHMNKDRVGSGVGYAAVALMVVGLAFTAAADISITKGTQKSRSTYPRGLSAITYVGGNSYYSVCDNGSEIGLYPCTIAVSDNGLTVNSFSTVATNQAIRLSGTSDLEGVAYDPATGNIWVAEESGKTIKEYNPATGAIIQALDIPNVMKQINGNYGFESLTISGDGLTLWTANEEALTVDGSRSSYTNSTTVRLVKYVRQTVNDKFQLAAMYPYTTEKWHNRYALGGSSRRGVSDLCALPDGSLLVLERELSSPTDGSDFWAKLDADFYYAIYRVSNFDMVTDIKDYPSLKEAPVVSIQKTLLYDSGAVGFNNYEGICFGKRLSDTSISLLMVTDSGDGNSSSSIQPLVLSGLNVRTLNFEEPAGYTASVKGNNYRYLNGSQVSVELAGPGITANAYTNNGDTVATVLWAMANQSPASGSGATAAFTVGGDGTLTWAVATSAAVSSLLANDSFEAYAVGTQGSDISGWSGEDAEVITETYTPAAGYPMDREAHTKVLSVDGDLTRTYPQVETNALQTLDFMVAVRHAPPGNDIAVPGPAAGNKLIVACNSNGVMCVKCTKPGGSAGWVELSSTTYENDDWVRVTLTFDYSSNSGGRAFAQVKLNGTECLTASGYASPTDLTTGGSWYELLDIGEKRCVTALVATGMCKLDDIMLSIEDVAEPAYIDGVPVTWLDALGLGRDPNLVFPANVKPNLSALGYTLGDAFAAGIDLSKDEPFKLIAITLLTDRRLRLTFNGVRDDKELSEVYHVYGMEKLGDAETLLSGTCVAGEGQTTWTSESATNPTNGFFKVRATR